MEFFYNIVFVLLQTPGLFDEFSKILTFAGKSFLVVFCVLDGFVDEFGDFLGVEVGGLDIGNKFGFGKVAKGFSGLWAGGNVGESTEEVEGSFWVAVFVFDNFEKGGFLVFEVSIVGVEIAYDEVVIEVLESIFDIANGVEPTDRVGEDLSFIRVSND